MNANQILSDCIHTIEDFKGHDIIVLPVAAMTDITDYMVIVTATSTRHAKAIGYGIMEKLAQSKIVHHVEGERDGDWILIDAGSVIVHVMQSMTREFYDLERLWTPFHSAQECTR